MRYTPLVLLAALLTIAAGPSHAECFGDGAYRVCTDTTYDADGDMSVRSYDTQGNSYSVDTETSNFGANGRMVESHDSMGNSYSVRSWADSAGTHSVDSMGNECTITNTGQMIGCGQ